MLHAVTATLAFASSLSPPRVCIARDPAPSVAIASRHAQIRLQGQSPNVAGVPQGGPPAGTAGGPPGGSPPPGGGPGGPPRGGPPPRTPIQKVLDVVFEAAFTLLYTFEPDGMLDSSKNLRVLWVRALLAASGELHDDVAKELLPAATKWVVSPAVAPLWA